jgi:hypothetical protein
MTELEEAKYQLKLILESFLKDPTEQNLQAMAKAIYARNDYTDAGMDRLLKKVRE